MRILAINVLSVLAQGDYQHMGRRFRRGGGGADSPEFILLVSALVAIAVTAILVSRIIARRQEQGYESAPALFSELCRAHGLKWNSRRILRKLATFHGITPCQLFVEPDRFAIELQDSKLAKYTAELSQLKNQLFGEPA